MVYFVLVRFAYLAVTYGFAELRLVPMTDHEKDVASITALAVPSPHLQETTDEEVYAAALPFMTAGSPEPVCSCR